MAARSSAGAKKASSPSPVDLALGQGQLGPLVEALKAGPRGAGLSTSAGLDALTWCVLRHSEQTSGYNVSEVPGVSSERLAVALLRRDYPAQGPWRPRAVARRKDTAPSALPSPVPGSVAHYAAERGQLRILTEIARWDRSLLQAADRDGRTPLHYAARAGQASAMHLLALLGVDLSCTDKSGCTPLSTLVTSPWLTDVHAAASLHHLLLFSCWRSIDVLRGSRTSPASCAPLVAAIVHARVNCVRVLLAAGGPALASQLALATVEHLVKELRPSAKADPSPAASAASRKGGRAKGRRGRAKGSPSAAGAGPASAPTSAFAPPAASSSASWACSDPVRAVLELVAALEDKAEEEAIALDTYKAGLAARLAQYQRGDNSAHEAAKARRRAAASRLKAAGKPVPSSAAPSHRSGEAVVSDSRSLQDALEPLVTDAMSCKLKAARIRASWAALAAAGDEAVAGAVDTVAGAEVPERGSQASAPGAAAAADAGSALPSASTIRVLTSALLASAARGSGLSAADEAGYPDAPLPDSADSEVFWEAEALVVAAGPTATSSGGASAAAGAAAAGAAMARRSGAPSTAADPEMGLAARRPAGAKAFPPCPRLPPFPLLSDRQGSARVKLEENPVGIATRGFGAASPFSSVGSSAGAGRGRAQGEGAMQYAQCGERSTSAVLGSGLATVGAGVTIASPDRWLEVLAAWEADARFGAARATLPSVESIVGSAEATPGSAGACPDLSIASNILDPTFLRVVASNEAGKVRKLRAAASRAAPAAPLAAAAAAAGPESPSASLGAPAALTTRSFTEGCLDDGDDDDDEAARGGRAGASAGAAGAASMPGGAGGASSGDDGDSVCSDSSDLHAFQAEVTRQTVFQAVSSPSLASRNRFHRVPFASDLTLAQCVLEFRSLRSTALRVLPARFFGTLDALPFTTGTLASISRLSDPFSSRPDGRPEVLAVEAGSPCTTPQLRLAALAMIRLVLLRAALRLQEAERHVHLGLAAKGAGGAAASGPADAVGAADPAIRDALGDALLGGEVTAEHVDDILKETLSRTGRAGPAEPGPKPQRGQTSLPLQ
ncbi:hypothetical protein FNF31_03535 [Cafeteria roenbergensis]|uniref:Uncharacterized protein n=1 Tax=Cafeteria roenbergensis TaxID=33653 RepID=A0A5A8D9P8_CAFRO|nr:hypothetical protein FNF31_03535 [Cafeteria roenbergensis]